MSAEFEAIIKLLEGAGDGILWVVGGYFLFRLLLVIVFFVGGCFLAKFLFRGLYPLVTSITIVRGIRDQLELGSEGVLITKEIIRVQKKVAEMIELYKEKGK